MMVEERIKIPVTPERTESEDVNLRRNSTGKTSTSADGKKVLPHYLRASTSSCHDFCKYGRRHAFEAKEKRLTLRGITAIPAESKDPMKIVALAGRKKKPVVRLKPSPNPKTKSVEPQIIKREALSPVNKTTLSAKQSSSSAERVVVSAKPATGLETKSMPAKLSSSPLNISGGSSARRNRESSKLGEKTPKASIKRVVSLNSRKYGNLKFASPLKKQIKVRKSEPKLPNHDNVKEKILYVIEPKSEKNEIHRNLSSPSSSPSSSMSLPSHEEEQQDEFEATVSEIKESVSKLNETENKKQIKTLKVENKWSPRRGVTVHPEDKNHSSQKLNFRKGKVVNPQSEISGPRRLIFRQGKVLGKKMSPSPKSEKQHREFETTVKEIKETVSKHNEIESKQQIKTLKVENMRRPRRVAMVHPEDKNCAPQKLNFRKGTAVNLHPEINSPRRLRFIQGKVLGGNQHDKGDTGRRSFRMRGVGVGDSDNTKVETKKIVLRHQDVQGKKEAQGLLNNVIEETASKLVETRKSKVMALVGAFETVISLQEKKKFEY